MSKSPRLAKYTDCPDRKKHTGEGPEGYLAWHEWAAEQAKTKRPAKCPTCNFFVMLVPRIPKPSRVVE